MKNMNRSSSVLASLFVALFLSGCEHNVFISSEVHEDGALDRTIVLQESDSGKIKNNIFGINESEGWNVVVERSRKSEAEADNNPKLNITFRRRFASVNQANDEMSNEADTAFHISSSFEKHNRWFYTYMEYADTYRALNLFKAVSKNQYFTKEDFAFINRLPAEGTRISSADSLYLARLNEKIFDFYGSRSIFEEFYQHLRSTLRAHDVALQWQDTLARKKEQLYQRFVEVGNLDDGDFLSVVDNLNIPLSAEARESMQRKVADIEKRLEFLSEAYSGKYVHSISMPWTVVNSNADSVVGDQLFWRPPVVKFLLSDFTMAATARKLNVWAVVLSAMVVVVTVGMFAYRGKRSDRALN